METSAHTKTDKFSKYFLININQYTYVTLASEYGGWVDIVFQMYVPSL